MNSFTCEYFHFIFASFTCTSLRLIRLVAVSSSHVSPEQYRHRFACLTFTVMDYDWLSTNDFAGEAVAPLSDFCWPGRPNATPAGKSVQPSILHLSRSKPSGTYGSRLNPAFLFYTHIILASWKSRGCSSGFPITSPIQHEKPFNLEIFVSGVGGALICLLSPPEKPIMRMLDARIGDREAQEFVRRLKEIEKSMEEE